MATEVLNALARTDTGKGAARKLRAAKQVPGVVYGHKRAPQSLALDARDLQKMLDRVSADTTVFELKIGSSTSRTLIRDIQRHPFRREIIHIDFQELVAGELVTVDVPVVLVGTPVGVRLSGGMLDQVLRTISVEVDPGNIPNHIDVDVTNLDLHQSIHVRDLNLPAGVEVLENEGETICVVAAPRAEVEVAPVAAEGAEPGTEPELIRKTKEEEEEEEKAAK
ncbi:MAG TPA: 50S ribosomal protein L25 [Gemmatimonadaceae bacterium]|nr:50S ribosomal protein L25 [Gemmatimonadaceae bacterium]